MSNRSSASRFSRRDVLGLAVAAAGVGMSQHLAAEEKTQSIPAIMPRGKGHQFVLYSDCCSGIPKGRFEKNLKRMNRMVDRVKPRPEFIAFPGDAISGYITNYDELRSQWDYWQKQEMKWLNGLGIPLYQSTSNHNTYDEGSEAVFIEKHPDIPQNGPEDQKGLAYFVRRGDLMYISTHQPDRRRFPEYRPEMLIDWKWLERVLTEHQDAKYKIVAGHYPVFPVNGYVENPQWCLKPEERQQFWDVLAKHQVDAYLGSHVIAFDVQIHDGIPQIISGGAGTNFGPGGFMPGLTEYFHAVQIALDDKGLRYQVLDVDGHSCESLDWPFQLQAGDKWQSFSESGDPRRINSEQLADKIVAWRFRGELVKVATSSPFQTLLCGFDKANQDAAIQIGIDGESSQLVVRLMTDSEYGIQSWTGPRMDAHRKFDFQIALHPAMGPGGVLWRRDDISPWSSLHSISAKGAEDLSLPSQWKVGHGEKGEQDQPFQGEKLNVTFTSSDVEKVE